MILSPSKKTNESISSLANLAKALDLTLDELEEIKKIPEDVRFTRVNNDKLAEKKRIVYKPHKQIRKIQDRIKNRIFKATVTWPEYLFGSIPNTTDENGFLDSRDYISCAKLHCGAKSIFKIDIENFFGNVHKDHVFIIFNNFFKYNTEVSEYLTDICCKDSCLPQGAPTSSYIASLCFWDKEENIVKKLLRKNLTYTRLVDDITVSSKTSNFNFEYVQKIISDMLICKDLPLNKNKTKVLYAGIESLTVHGLRVDFDVPRLPADEVGRIRAAVHNVCKMSKQNNYRTYANYRKQYYRCMGRVNKLARVNHNKHTVLLDKLKLVYPLPSKTDLKKAEAKTTKLELLFSKYGKEEWYKKEFNYLRYFLTIISKTYPKSAKVLSDKLKLIKPNAET